VSSWCITSCDASQARAAYADAHRVPGDALREIYRDRRRGGWTAERDGVDRWAVIWRERLARSDRQRLVRSRVNVVTRSVEREREREQSAGQASADRMTGGWDYVPKAAMDPLRDPAEASSWTRTVRRSLAFTLLYN